jgi:hypothetical protein
LRKISQRILTGLCAAGAALTRAAAGRVASAAANPGAAHVNAVAIAAKDILLAIVIFSLMLEAG